MMKGTPYIYQGEEIGMTNVQFDSIEDYRDIEIHQFYQEQLEDGMPVEKIMESIYAKGRDNSRTPMQWDHTKNAGFSTGIPWIKVNTNYKKVNAEDAIADPDSIYHYYRKLIKLRKEHEVIVYGSYDLLLEDHKEIFAYKRSLNGETLVVFCNFSEKEIELEFSQEYSSGSAVMLISNYQDTDEKLESTMVLRSYEVRVYLLR